MYSKKLKTTSEKEIKMNIKVKAALEVAGGLVALVAVSFGIRTLLDSLAQAYSPEDVANGIIFVLISTTAYIMVGLLYDIRVNQLKYKEKLQEMTKK